MHKKFDLAIIGAGPAGCICAYLLAGQGLKVALIEKAVFPRDKICGDALSPDVVNQLYLIDKPMAERFLATLPKKAANGIRFIAPNFKALDIQFTNPAYPAAAGFIAKRLDFDNFLFEQLKLAEDITIFQGQPVEKLERSDGEVKIFTKDQIIAAKMVVGADGAHSVVRRKFANNRIDKNHYCAGVRQYFEGVAGMDEHENIELHFYRELLPGYLWIFSLPGGQANVGIGMLSSEISKQKINLKEMLSQLIKNHPMLKDRFKQAKPLEKVQGFGLPIGSRKLPCSGDNFLLLGDAASLIDPFTGEGIGNAIRSGRVAAKHLLKAFDHNRYNAHFHKYYDREIYDRMWTELRVSRAMQKMLRYPRLFNMIVNKANKNESIRMLLTSMLTNLDLRKELRKPSFYTKLFFK